MGWVREFLGFSGSCRFFFLIERARGRLRVLVRKRICFSLWEAASWYEFLLFFESRFFVFVISVKRIFGYL